MCHHNGSLFLYLWRFFIIINACTDDTSLLPFSLESSPCLAFCLHINSHSSSTKQQTQIHFSDSSCISMQSHSITALPEPKTSRVCSTRRRNRFQLHAADVSLYMKCMWRLEIPEQIESSSLTVPVQNKLWLDICFVHLTLNLHTWLASLFLQ